MIKIKDYILEIEPEHLINKLKSDLKIIKGKDLFQNIKLTNRAVMFTCPFHKKGRERKPSAGLLYKDSQNLKSGTVHCFTCGYTKDFTIMVSELFDIYYDIGKFGEKWLLGIGNIFNIDIPKPSVGNKYNDFLTKSENIISEDELQSYRFTVDYMYERKLTDEIIELFDVGYQSDYVKGKISYPCLTFPLRNLRGEVIQIVRRAINCKKWFLPVGEKNIYGLYEFLQSRKKNKTDLIIVESIINCLTLWSWGYTAVALLGLGTYNQLQLLQKYVNPLENIYIAMDGDIAGRKAGDRIAKFFTNSYIYNIPNNKDINDLSVQEFENLTCKPKRFY